MGVDVLEIGLRDRVDGGGGNRGRGGVAGAAGVGGADRAGENAVRLVLGGDGGGAVGIGDDPAELLGEEEEGLVFLGVEVAGDVERAAEGPSEIIVVERGDLRLAAGIHVDPGGVVEEIVGGKLAVAEEFVGVAMEPRSAGLGDDLHLGSSRAAGFGGIAAAHHLELGNGVDAGRVEQRQIGTAVDIVGTVHLPGAAGVAGTVDGERDGGGLAGGKGNADIKLVDGSRADAGHEGHQLLIVACHQRRFADLGAFDGGGLLRTILQFDLDGG